MAGTRLTPVKTGRRREEANEMEKLYNSRGRNPCPGKRRKRM